MNIELSVTELECELSAELPTRALMRRHRHSAHAHAHASFGSAANANATHQVNSNPQTVVNSFGLGGGTTLTSHNSNHNTTNQNALPINFGI